MKECCVKNKKKKNHIEMLYEQYDDKVKTLELQKELDLQQNKKDNNILFMSNGYGRDRHIEMEE